MSITTVTIVVKDNALIADGIPLTFVFEEENEAEKFDDHLRTLYNLEPMMVRQSIDNYDTAIQSLVEAIGPSNG